MYPVLIEFGDFFLPSWHAFYVLGSLCAWLLVQRWRPRLAPSLAPRSLDSLFLIIYIAGYFGARLLSIGLEREYQASGFSWLHTPFQLGSMTLYGGVLLAAASVLVWNLKHRLSLLELGDLLVPGTLIAVALGRIGCFLNGDDFGKAVSSQLQPPWWSVTFPNLADGIYRYPVQLLESLGCGLCLTLSTVILASPRRLQGQVADVCIGGYALLRFGLEFLRDDERGVLISPLLSPAQWISLLLLALWFGYRIFLSLILKRVPRPLEAKVLQGSDRTRP